MNNYYNINHDIKQLREEGKQYKEISMILEQKYGVCISTQTIRYRYEKFKNIKFDDLSIFTYILQGKTIKKISGILGISIEECNEYIKKNERALTSRCRTFLKTVEESINAKAPKREIDEFIDSIARQQLSRDRINEIYTLAFKIYIESYVACRKDYYRHISPKHITIYDIIKCDM